MARNPIAWLAGSLVLLVSLSDAQTHNWTFAIAARGGITTTSRIYPNPDAASIDLRTINTPFNSVLSGGLEFRFKWFDDSYFFYLSTQYLSKTNSELQLDGSLSPPRRVPVEEGYRVIPVELGTQLYVPLGSTTPWRLSMGGGFGAYYTERILKVAGVEAVPVGSRIGFGIHVGIRGEYRLFPGVSVLGSMTFRDPEIDVKNKFTATSIMYNNSVVNFPAGELHSRVNIDGITFGVGLVVEVL